MNRKTVISVIVLAALAVIPVVAQQAQKPSIPSTDTSLYTKLYGPGDKIFSISLGADYPAFNLVPSTGATLKPNMYVGGVFSLEWSFFVAQRLALGGEVSGAFNSTPAERTLFIVPLTFKTSYFFGKLPWEFPVSLGVGGCFDTVSDLTHIDMFFKPEAGVFYRATPDWSFGASLSWWIIPQIYSDHPDQTRIANIPSIRATAMYHF